MTDVVSTTELDAIRQTLEAAENANEAQVFVDLMADDVVVMVPDYPVQEGKAAASAFVCGINDWMRENLDRHITYESGETRIAGDLAFDRGTFAFTVGAKQGGDRTRITGKYFYVYRRESAAWKLWRVIMSTDEDEEKVEEAT